MRRVAWCLVAALCAATAAPAGASTAERDARWVRKYTFRAQGPGQLDVSGTVAATGKGIFGSIAYINAAGTQTLSSTLNDFDSQVGLPRPYGVSPPVNHCGLGISCTIRTTPGRLTFRYSANISQNESERLFSIDLYLFGQGKLEHLVESLDRWRRPTVRQGGLMVVDTTETASVGVTGGGYYAEASSSITLTSRKPSFAVAPIPCGTAGGGIVSLDGGEEPDVAICPTGQKVLEGRSISPTTWVVMGPSVGATPRSTRLAVVDM